MKFLPITILLIISLNFVFAQNKQTEIQTNAQLALAYYNARDFEKAAPLLLNVYNMSKNSYYFRLYLTSLLELNQHEEALKKVEEEVNKVQTPDPDLFIHWGYILKSQNKNEEAIAKYNQALEMIPQNKGNYLNAANNFLQWREYEWAEKVYQQGRKAIPQEPFYFEMARINLYLRDYDQMMEEYLNLIRQDDKQLQRVQSSLASAMSLDVDDGLRDQFREQVLKRIQSEPQVIGYNRLLIWFFLQEKKFSAALRQAVALDRRSGQEDAEIYQLAQMALNSRKYEDAQKAYNYLMEKGESNPFFKPAYAQSIHTAYLAFTSPGSISGSGAELVEKFDKGLEYMDYSPSTLNLIQEYAHLLAFYLNDVEKAKAVLQKGLEIPRLTPEQEGLLKTELADVYLYSNDPWEATLLYSQSIEANKDNTLGDMTKLKKAQLGYYLGNFSWAKAQLDVLKASTSKLTANDALDLSMLIGNNLNMDTTSVPLEMFSRADLLFFRNKDSLAMATLDSLAEMYPFHSLVDEILFRKAKIEIRQENFTKAAEHLEHIRSDFGYDLLADDALYQLAEVYNYQLEEKEKARDYYYEMLVKHPGSVFTEESREKYRELRELYPDKNPGSGNLDPVENQLPDEPEQ